MSRDGILDMFWEQPWWQQGYVDGCRQRFGVEPRPSWAAVQWGGRKISAASNIVFANGMFAWHRGQDLESSLRRIPSLLSVIDAACSLEING